MAKKKKQQQAPTPTGYDLLCQRIERTINGPRAQRERTVVIAREPEEAQEDWERMLEDLDTIEEVDMEHQEDGSVRLLWKPADDD